MISVMIFKKKIKTKQFEFDEIFQVMNCHRNLLCRHFRACRTLWPTPSKQLPPTFNYRNSLAREWRGRDCFYQHHISSNPPTTTLSESEFSGSLRRPWFRPNFPNIVWLLPRPPQKKIVSMWPVFFLLWGLQTDFVVAAAVGMYNSAIQ